MLCTLFPIIPLKRLYSKDLRWIQAIFSFYFFLNLSCPFLCLSFFCSFSLSPSLSLSLFIYLSVFFYSYIFYLSSDLCFKKYDQPILILEGNWYIKNLRISYCSIILKLCMMRSCFYKVFNAYRYSMNKTQMFKIV